jgi:hypothetical protein
MQLHRQSPHHIRQSPSLGIWDALGCDHDYIHNVSSSGEDILAYDLELTPEEFQILVANVPQVPKTCGTFCAKEENSLDGN